jgi:hypothetical protein
MKNSKSMAIMLVVLTICSNLKMFGQASSAGFSNSPFAAQDYIGWKNGVIGLGILTLPELTIKNEDPMPISFYTNAGAGTFNNMRMTILGNGRVGIGINNPLWQLDVADEINISQPRNYYMIGGETVLHNAGTENIFTGVNCGKDILAGNASGNMNTFNGFSAGEFASGNDNVFIGDNTGRYSNGQSNIFIGTSAGIDNLGDYNSIVGFTAGMYLTTGNENTFMGLRAGECNTTGSYNTFYGSRAGIGQNPATPIVGRNNSFFGYASGQAIKDGNENIFAGSHSGNSNSSGSYNTFIGSNAGYYNDKGTYNTYIGNNAGSPVNFNLHYASAIGTNATAVNDKVMILGDNDINVGIGMSGVAGGPLTKLQILSSINVPQFRISYDYGNNIHTNFQTTAGGDLFINPFRNGANRFVGINTVSPQNTLEINSNATYVANQTGESGLRFTDLRLGSQEDPSNGKVLSVDADGDVILVRDIVGVSVNSTCTTQDIVARFDNTGNIIQCSDIYNNASATPNNSIGFFTTTPQYKFQMEGTALFTRNHITTPFGLTVHGQNNPPAVMIESKDDEGLSILHSATTSPNVKDQMKIYGDDNRQYHLRMVGTPTGNSTPNSITFDHEDNGGSVNSWMGYNTLSRITVMKDDFNSNPVPASPAGIVLGYAVYASKFFVEAQTPTYAGNYMVYGLTAGNTNSNSEKYHAGVFGYSSGSRIGQVSNKGAMFYATGASGSNTSSLGSNIGVEAKAISTSTFTDSYGVYTTALGGQHTNYGIYSLVKGSGCANGSCTSAAGFFNGAVYTTQNTYFTSDSSLKQNITFIGHKDTLLNHIPVYSFNYDTLNNYGLNLETGTHYGVLAHEVKQVLPQMVRNFIQPAEYDSSGTIVSQQKNIQAVNYTEFIPLLIAGYKSQAKEIDTLTNQLTTLQSRLDSLVMAVASCCNAPLLNQNNSSNQQTIELDNTPAIILGNDPNPFAENTTINWNIPQQDTETLNAMLVFYNQNGSILKSVKIHQAGAGSLLVYGSKLSSGTYSYSLVINGKTIETKRMMKVK